MRRRAACLTMKKYAILITVSVCLIAALSGIPALTDSMMTRVELTQVQKTTHQDYVYASGQVEQKYQKEVLSNFPLVIADILKEAGDPVQEGDVIFKVDKNATLDMMSSFGQYNSIPSGYLELIGAANASEVREMLPDTLEATEDGYISSMNCTIGAINEAGKVLCTIAKSDEVVARLSVNEISVPNVKIGQSVVLTGNGFQGKVFTGEIYKISPTAKKQLNGTTQETVVDVMVRIHEPDDSIKAGYTVKGQIVTSEKRQLQTIPYEAVLQDEQNIEFVYVLENGRAVRRDIQTGLELSDGVEVVEGLTPDDIVIFNAQQVKQDGEHVKVRG